MSYKTIIISSLCIILFSGCGQANISNTANNISNDSSSAVINNTTEPVPSNTVTDTQIETSPVTVSPTTTIPDTTPTTIPPDTTTPPADTAIPPIDTTTPPVENTVVTYSSSDVAKHNNSTNCWQIIDTKIYDVTSYISQHPGGPSIISGCGKDATAMFDSVGDHASIQSLLAKYYIGDLK